MRIALLVALGLLAILLTFFPMFDATKRDRSAWPWIVGGFVFGPFAGIVYLALRPSFRIIDALEDEVDA